MPRKLRMEYPGAMYHMMSWGDRREDIFLDDVDRQDFLKTLAGRASGERPATCNLQPCNLQPCNLQPCNLQPCNLQPLSVGLGIVGNPHGTAWT